MDEDMGTPRETEDRVTDDGTDEPPTGDDGTDEPPTGDDDTTGSDGRDDSAAGDDGAIQEEPRAELIEFADAKGIAVAAAEDLIDHPLDSVIRIERNGNGWRALVEVVERSAVPDTQDILGRYEVVIDDDGTLLEYGLEERYRRGENRDEL